MGYKPVSHSTIDFKGTFYEGAEVVIRTDQPIDKVRNILDQVSTMEGMDGFEKQCDLFGKEVLVSWNLVDEKDKPIAADAKGLRAIPANLAKYIISQWFGMVWAVRDPLPGSKESSA